MCGPSEASTVIVGFLCPECVWYFLRKVGCRLVTTSSPNALLVLILRCDGDNPTRW